MAISKRDLRVMVRRRLNDADATFWSDSEIDQYLLAGYRLWARRTRAIWDLHYAENLPRGMSYTAPFEADLVDFDYGQANFTAAFERRLFLEDEGDAVGPANHTVPFEAINGHLSDAGASTAIPATADLPPTVTEIDRPLWDQRAIPVITPREAQARDSRYELTEGEVYALVTEGQGVRTIRKVRVPAMMADAYTVEGSWGILRRPTDVTTGTVTGTWGCPRRLPGHHPMGSEAFGLPRRVYRDGKNVRIEHWGEGRALDTDATPLEVPDRAAVGLRDYVLSRCYQKAGPAQDLKLSAHYEARWQRSVTRWAARVTAQQRNRVSRMGGATAVQRSGPPRPQLPWTFGVVVR